ncbi:MAG: non-ribosomal peptide synthetase, partial [Modestobacter sp.]|nr:non-ribosomal peptide synthetase [Modestobacter sp.]
PTISGLARAFPVAASAPASLEGVLADMLADVLKVERVPVEAHFFDDLGADSMVMAQFCARVRKRPDLPSVSMKDVYQHPTIGGLATAFAATAPAPAGSSTAAPVAAPTEAGVEAPARASTFEYVLCGALQFLIFVGYCFLSAVAFEKSYGWIAAGQGLVDDYQRSVVAGGVTFLAMCTLPIVAKWLLIGRWKPRQIRIWSLGYVRFWMVKTLVAANPLVLFAGSPVYTLYLRALGAKVGRGVVIFSRHAPVCTDLLTIGDGTIIRKDTYLNCYRAQAGLIQTGPVTLGKDVFVGDKAVLDIRTSLGDGSQLGHASALHAGQGVPAGERWHGSPAQPTESDYRGVATADCSTWRRARYAIGQLLPVLFVYLPVVFGGVATLIATVPSLAALLEPGPLALRTWSFYAFALAVSLSVFFGGLLVRFLFIVTVPRLLNLAVKPDTAYRLYGIRYSAHRTIMHLTNSKLFQTITGDSSFVVHYLRSLGYKLSPVVQTGSNFGTEVKHETPFLNSVGSGTVVASGLSLLNAHYSSTSFSVSRTAIGSSNFLGNDIVYPPGGRTGDNCLLATKVLVPIDGEVRQGVGLLGSPSFEIPRTVARDSKFIQMAHGEDFPRRLAAKNKHNLATIGLYLLARWVHFFVLTVVVLSGLDLLDSFGPWAIALSEILILLFSLFYFSFVERASTGFRGVQPKHCSIYERDFWQTERFFKLCARMGVHRLCAGTPFKSVIWRLVGVRLGKRLFDDGSGMSEKNIVTIGDDVTLNAGSYIQCHSQEDYAFKSDRITIGSGCTIGVGAMVHYGVTMGDGSVLAADSFLMKGEEMPPHAQWGGNPAREMRDDMATVQVRWAGDGIGDAAPTSSATPRPDSHGRHRPGRRQAAVSAMALVDGGRR